MRGLGSGHVTCGPMRGIKGNFTGRGQTDKRTDKRTDGHRDSLADSVKICFVWIQRLLLFYINKSSRYAPLDSIKTKLCILVYAFMLYIILIHLNL